MTKSNKPDDTANTADYDYSQLNNVDDLKKALILLKIEHKKSINMLTKYRARIKEIENSQSWRLTAPLRRTNAVISNIKNQRPVSQPSNPESAHKEAKKISSDIQTIEQKYRTINQKINIIINNITIQEDSNEDTATVEEQLRQANKLLKSVEKSIKDSAKQKTKDKESQKQENKKTESKKTSKPKKLPPPLENGEYLELLRSTKPRDGKSLIRQYEASELAKEQDTFVLYRIIGNDLYPRHKLGQSRENLRFILENEPDLENCEKRFILNRIIDQNEEAEIIKLLRKHGKQYRRIAFKPEEYQAQQIDTDCLPYDGFLASDDYDKLGPQQKVRLITALYRHKNNYVMHNNGARNTALKDGKKHAKWVLPWDGNCFITKEAWQQIVQDVTKRPHLKYFAVPMARMLDNTCLLEEAADTPEPVEEPQLLFRKDAREKFNENYCYGRRPKVELFWRLRIPGKWDRWRDDPWDQPREPISRESLQFGAAGWVARLYSGQKSLETDGKEVLKNRGLARNDAIITTLQYIDSKLQHTNYISLDKKTLHEEVVSYKDRRNKNLINTTEELLVKANTALSEKPYSITDKKSIAPSNDKQDYWHPAPYWWPNPNTDTGLPYIRRDGQRVPGTQLGDEECDNFDRSGLQQTFDNSLLLALAYKFTAQKKYANHGAKMLRRFFLQPKTRMNPHLKYSQVRMGVNGNEGTGTGIIEFKDIYYYLDAASIFHEAGAVTDEELDQFKQWLSAYLDWLLSSPQGISEKNSENNHGTYYDLQILAIATFLGDKNIAYETILRAQSRIATQFDQNGRQPEELMRTITQHYSVFNLQAWVRLADMAQRWGINLWEYQSSSGASLKRTIDWLLSTYKKPWPYEQIDAFDMDRYLPIRFQMPEKYQDSDIVKRFSANKYKNKSVYHIHDGIQPFWNIGLGANHHLYDAVHDHQNIDALRNNYFKNSLDKQKNNYIYCRIIGNDLLPRHGQHQTMDNLKFILENEPKLQGCTKHFVLNRIVDKSLEKKYIKLIEEAGHDYSTIPFRVSEYKKAKVDYAILPDKSYLDSSIFASLDCETKNEVLVAVMRKKINYAMNVNGARNFCLELGREKGYKWILPWDGGSYMTEAAWEQLTSSVKRLPYFKYIMLPNVRIVDNSELLDNQFNPSADEEPPIIFRQDAKEQFDTNYFYGRRDKVELLWRLGYEGKWDLWEQKPWDLPRNPLSTEAKEYMTTSYAVRMSSGRADLDKTNKNTSSQRNLERNLSILYTLSELDKKADIKTLKQAVNQIKKANEKND